MWFTFSHLYWLSVNNQDQMWQINAKPVCFSLYNTEVISLFMLVTPASIPQACPNKPLSLTKLWNVKGCIAYICFIIPAIIYIHTSALKHLPIWSDKDCDKTSWWTTENREPLMNLYFEYVYCSLLHAWVKLNLVKRMNGNTLASVTLISGLLRVLDVNLITSL